LDWEEEQEKLKQSGSTPGEPETDTSVPTKSTPQVKTGKNPTPKSPAPVKKSSAPKKTPSSPEIKIGKKKPETSFADEYEKQKQAMGIDVKKKNPDDEEELNENIKGNFGNLRDYFSF
jgi:hypothetical protein